MDLHNLHSWGGGNSLLLEPCSDQQKGSEGISVKIDTLMFEYKTVSGKYIYINQLQVYWPIIYIYWYSVEVPTEYHLAK